MMNIGSLFSGIGGIEIGFEEAGFKTAWCVENEPYAQQVLKKRFPKTPIYGDITQVDFRKLPKVDIIAGGFPCQDISKIGKRSGMGGSRSSLWKYFIKAVGILRPRYAFIENVPEITHRGLDVVLADLASVRYAAEWHCVPASIVGAQHKRERIFIIAYPDSWGPQDTPKLLEESEKERRLGKTCPDLILPWENIRAEIRKGTFTAESAVGRDVSGIPHRLDRIRCLGNAVIPQIAEIFAKAIKEAEE